MAIRPERSSDVRWRSRVALKPPQSSRLSGLVVLVRCSSSAGLQRSFIHKLLTKPEPRANPSPTSGVQDCPGRLFWRLLGLQPALLQSWSSVCLLKVTLKC